MLKNIVFRDGSLNGWEYGMLRSFERAIVEENNAEVIDIPAYHMVGSGMLRHFGHGMKRGGYRKYFPKQPFEIEADIAWYVLMGPENYKLDLYKGWEQRIKKKVLYLYDTLPAQYPAIKKLFSDHSWDVLITSFNEAVDDLQKITGRKWHCVEQAADPALFLPVSISERSIHFSSYGRSQPVLHQTLKEFCQHHHLYYDYTTHDAKHPVADPSELYKQYAWHLTHSLFTFSWPVEMTNPLRSEHLRPVTCRWFEAAHSGTIILGQAPDNPKFSEYLSSDLVNTIDVNCTKEKLFEQLENVWKNREDLHQRAMTLQTKMGSSITWQQRVKEINQLLQ